MNTIDRFRVNLMKLKFSLFERRCGPYYFTEILRLEGIDVGQHTIFYGPKTMEIDRQRPWMLKIGDYCKITAGTTILTHDYSRSVLRRVYGDVVAEAGETVIGDNVFIGMNSIILMGAHIGNNVIIGAGSVVNGFIPDNCVAAGNPCKVIRSLEEHYAIRKNKTINEAKKMAIIFNEKYNRWPNISEMGAFFPLYLERSRNELEKNQINTKLNGDDEEDVIRSFLQTSPIYPSFDAFIEECKNSLGQV